MSWGLVARTTDLVADRVIPDCLWMLILVLLRTVMVAAKWGYLGASTEKAMLNSGLPFSQRRMFEAINGWHPLPAHLILKELFLTYRCVPQPRAPR